MPEKNPTLGDSLMRLAAVPAQQPLTREQWITKFSKITLRSVIAVAPEGEAYPLDASWVLIRVGSFWRQDEEHHVYSMEQAVLALVTNKTQRPQAETLVVTPIWVFRSLGSRAVPVASEELLRIAERNFMRYIDELCKRSKPNG